QAPAVAWRARSSGRSDRRSPQRATCRSSSSPTVSLFDRHLFAAGPLFGTAAIGTATGVELPAVTERITAVGRCIGLVADVGDIQVLVVLVGGKEVKDLSVLAAGGVGDEVDVTGPARDEDGLNRIETGVADRVRRQPAVLVGIERTINVFQVG